MRLSLWFNSHAQAQMLPRLAQAAESLPSEALERGVQQLNVMALSWSEPPLLEERVDSGLPVRVAIDQMAEFVQEDCACVLEMAWLLWNYGDHGWVQQPRPVVCTSVGTGFGDGVAEQEGQIQIDFGLDEAFLAEQAPWDAATRAHLQANILQLLEFSHKAQRVLKPARRRLWSEAEDDWSQKLALRLQAAEGLRS